MLLSPNCIEAGLQCMDAVLRRGKPCFSQNSKAFFQSYLNENWMR